MRGYLMGLVCILSAVIFCVSLFTTENVSMVWLFLELATLALVPTFFLGRDCACLSSLFSYLVVSSVSSSFIICGILYESLGSFLFLGFLIKFGIFPFFGWVYSVILGSNWVVSWGFSILLKSPFLLLCFFLSSGGSTWLNGLAILTFLSLSSLFWVYTYSWLHCWCHMMLSSSVALVCMSVVISSELVLSLFFVYAFWSSLVILFFWSQDSDGLSSLGSAFFYSVLLLSFPASLAIFYKLLMGFCIYSCYFPVFVGWVLYSLSEQFYLLKLLIDLNVPRLESGVMGLV